ncbi:MAG: hypothetical protein ACREDD_06145 [Methylocella sp.]
MNHGVPVRIGLPAGSNSLTLGLAASVDQFRRGYSSPASKIQTRAHEICRAIAKHAGPG